MGEKSSDFVKTFRSFLEQLLEAIEEEEKRIKKKNGD